jgi:uncharacterized protein DUF2550
MGIVGALGIGILTACATLLLIYVRRAVISRAGGTIEMSMRLSTFVPGRGWAPGLARFTGDELHWYRMFSLDPRPRRILSRSNLVVEQRRTPDQAERYALPVHWVVLLCRGVPAAVEIALAESALTGFLSWLEAAPPGALRRR